MKRIINRKTYNTDTGIKVGAFAAGAFGDADGYEEILYKTPRGDYFLYGVGGDKSKYINPAITPLTEEAAKSWLSENK